MQKTILIVDDDEKFIRSLKYNLNEENYKIDYIYTGELLLQKVKEKNTIL